MKKDIPDKTPKFLEIYPNLNFNYWTTLNDTIMGGASQAQCRATSNGLFFEGNLVEEGGGFVSCRSPVLSPSLDLTSYKGFLLEVEGNGSTLKFGVSCEENFISIEKILPGAIKWVTSIPTKKFGITSLKIPFQSLEASIRAKPVFWPTRFNPSRVKQFQLLYSKFGQPGKLNNDFKSGDMNILLRSINAYS